MINLVQNKQNLGQILTVKSPYKLPVIISSAMITTPRMTHIPISGFFSDIIQIFLRFIPFATVMFMRRILTSQPRFISIKIGVPIITKRASFRLFPFTNGLSRDLVKMVGRVFKKLFLMVYQVVQFPTLEWRVEDLSQILCIL